MSILNYFKKVDQNKLTPKSENLSPAGGALSAKKATENQLMGKTEEKARKKLALKDEKENDVDMTDDDVVVSSRKAKPQINDDFDDESDEIKPLMSKANRLSEVGRDSPKIAKRKRIMVMDSDSDESEESQPKEVEKKEKPSKPKKSKKKDSDYEDDDDFIDDDDEEEEKPKAKPKKTVISNKNLGGDFSSPKSSPKSTPNKASVCSPATKSALSSFAAANVESDDGPLEGKFVHLTYAFLEDDKIRDLDGRKKSDPDYNPRTIFVPPEFKKTLTPAMKQWWELKQTNFDVLFFFKVGKFYELYHQDAVVAVKELGLTFMKGNYAHCGFPEIAFSRFGDALVSKGYKVGRVEQTETPEMMTERTKGTRLDKTVRREICRVTTPGTKTFNLLDSEVSSAFSQYLFSFVEKVSIVQDKKVRTYGVCFVDTTVGKIHIGQFEDDRNCSKFRTTLAQYPPAHILYDKNNISKETKHIVDLQSVVKEGLVPEKEMIGSAALLRQLAESDCFKEKGAFEWPASFKEVLSEFDSLGLTAKSEYELALNAMGGVVWCLQKCLIDNEILSMKNFEIYKPVDNILTDDVKKSEIRKQLCRQKYMVLDSISLTNLEVIENNFDNTQAGTLYEQLDYCNTQFGKRLLKFWLVNPLCDPDAINDRLDAVEDLMKLDEKIMSTNDMLKSLPDLERLVSKIHQLGNVKKDHPDSRAVMYENDTYSKKKVEDFILILSGFATAARLLNSLKDSCANFKSKLLKSILTITKENENRRTGFPYLDDLLKFYQNSFDAEQARKDGKIIPSPGVNEDYDKALDDIKNIEKGLEKYLREQNRNFNAKVIYFGTGKNRYQLEIPESRCNNVPKDFELTSSKKGYKRYWSSEIKQFIADLTDAETRRDQALRDTMKSLFKNFDNHYNVWSRAVQCLAILDVLISLSSYTRNAQHNMCRPECVVLDENSSLSKPFIEIREGRHPCLIKTFSGDFIPNDILIGCEDVNNNWQKNPLILVTGPNMGGKSTLMRQAGLTIILAQMGCYVPAESCRFSPVDRIFTRIGASDKILAGESTFFLELSETASILHHATKHSLVLMDELGRGTATFDGTAIAYSVVKELAQKIKCRSLFSTHYHHLVEEFSDKDNVSMGHMQCMVDDDDQNITFLYKFGEGACPKSHGFNAARLADIPDEIIKVGSHKSSEFENFTVRIQLLKKLLHAKGKRDVADVMEKFKSLKTN